MNYPKFIITWTEGRIPCPPQYRGTVIAKQFTSGHIGGKRVKEHTTDDPMEAVREYNKDLWNRTAYMIPERGRQRQRIRIEQLLKMAT